MAISKFEIEAAADDLQRALISAQPTARLLDRFPGLDVDSAYAIQLWNVKRALASGRKISGKKIGLTSKAMTAPDGKIRIPLNEESAKGSGQIEEFLMAFNGEGIQHIAFLTDNLIQVIDNLQMAGVDLMTAPNDFYYDALETRLPGHGQPVGELKSRGILLDGTTEGGKPRLLLQIFSKTLLGPVFFEFIQREGDDGFGEGNFKALFESLERDQIERGTLKV